MDWPFFGRASRLFVRRFFFFNEKCFDAFSLGNKTKIELGLRVKRVEGKGHSCNCTHTDRSGPPQFLFFLIYLKWLITVLAPHKTKTLISIQWFSGN